MSKLKPKMDMSFFTFVWSCIVTNLFVTEPTRCTNFINLFWHETVHVSDSSSVHHQEFIHCTLSNVMCAVCRHVWHIPLLSVQWINSCWWTEELSETCRVSCQNKFVKSVHLVGFIIKKWTGVLYIYIYIYIVLIIMWNHLVVIKWGNCAIIVYH